MVVVATTLSMAKGQGEAEREEPEDGSYEMMMVIVLALRRLLSLLWSLMNLIQRRPMKKPMIEDEQSERKS